MRQAFVSSHRVDKDGNPAGGHTQGWAFTVVWQDGPLWCGEVRRESNGAFVETILAVALDRLEFWQKSRFACAENGIAIERVQEALKALAARGAGLEQRRGEEIYQA